MKPRTFNSIAHFFNETWAARATGVNINPEKGPDLISDDKIIEVKFNVIYPDEYRYVFWKVLEYQMDYNKDELGRKAYWGLGTYTLKKHASDIQLKDIRELERLVLSRTLTIVSWNWMNQFPPYHQTGKTKYSKWNNTLRYPKERLLPRIIADYKVRGGEVRICEGINPGQFNIKTR